MCCGDLSAYYIRRPGGAVDGKLQGGDQIIIINGVPVAGLEHHEVTVSGRRLPQWFHQSQTSNVPFEV
jgi:hypothetical protein